jgi:hypothetical protein
MEFPDDPETCSMYLEDERNNLNIITDGRILVIADLGLWNGRRQGYKVLGQRVSDILSDDADYIEWYGDGHNIKATAIHHDGRNYYEYRVIREDRNINNLLNAIYSGEQITRKKLNYYTKSLYKDVAKIYGW